MPYTTLIAAIIILACERGGPYYTTGSHSEPTCAPHPAHHEEHGCREGIHQLGYAITWAGRDTSEGG
eukprot:5375789-Alexandrium_andersonii.AAC.1